jgi:hypothetical protein
MNKKLIIMAIMIASVTSMQAALQALQDEKGGGVTTTTSSGGGGGGYGQPTGAPTRIKGTGGGITSVKGGPATFKGNTRSTITTTGHVATSLSTIQNKTPGKAGVDLEAQFLKRPSSNATASSSSLKESFKALMRPLVAPVRKVTTGRSGLSNKKSRRTK